MKWVSKGLYARHGWVKQQHRMFWNQIKQAWQQGYGYVKQQHRMFWNLQRCLYYSFLFHVKQQHRMFWNQHAASPMKGAYLLNNNIGCFEITAGSKLVSGIKVKQQHRMFWNPLFYIKIRAV